MFTLQAVWKIHNKPFTVNADNMLEFADKNLPFFVQT